ncbi:cyclin-dependent kinase inhibitor 1 isoform X2 [Cyclopterus lumpus]|nr:cyclin-dependent kinase inhibitor 1 isoform X2 [Cyclopterus lumpus]XP_034389192.1 cyclin-dependent kinase inhibitor 1 isoform X2 [Cyclopterus lumpus]XP_034389193.1 cyclin-dependent kinase inhibitor 1 isoform X2 [Cyclopterus lumpus]
MDTHKPILRTGTARRNLFGPVDREQLQMEYQAIIRSDLEEACNRWGFDFLLDKPLENSNFQWEGIPDTKVPLFYRSAMLGLGYAEGQRAAEAAVKPKEGGRVELPEREKENTPCSPERCTVNQDNTPGRREDTGLKRRQTNLTDFYQAKRRVVGMPRKSGE